ncbi:MAG: Mth938-like domain-containing protein [Sinobacteraceae bacterium]|nr:Mth938-like domain-containing protein [Nevskiaceae bacterium]
MKFTLDTGSSPNLIRTYSPGSIRVAEQLIERSCLISAQTLITDWEPQTLDELQPAHLGAIFALQPELVVLGTGPQHRFAPVVIRAAFNTRGVGLESMDLGAACRTFNVLVQEERRVVAALFLR